MTALPPTQLDLNGPAWQFRLDETMSPGWRAATVPGCVHTDLLRHGAIRDPFYGRNELDLGWIEQADWEYRREFTAGADLLAHEHVDLVLDGLDTVAVVSLNGEVVLESENMFHRHRVPVKRLLRPGANVLHVRFGSAAAYIAARRTDFTPPKEFNDPVGNCVRIRKQQCQFGWDWGPRFVTCGVWRDARLEGWSGNRIESVHVRQAHRDGAVELTFDAALARPGRGELRGDVRLGGEVVARIADGKARVDDPQLWWPAGHGAQPLYDVAIELEQDGRILSRWAQRIGLRVIELDREPDGLDDGSGADPTPNRFGFRVNGRLVFAKGANWIPAHAFVHALTRDDYAPLLRAAVDANMNTIRLWGGGIYEHDAFYDLCDELGLLVFHDFMFACTLYPADEAFLASVRREVADQVPRIRHHACLALWCGNNELVSCNTNALNDPSLRDGYAKLFLDAIPAALREVDPVTPYLHSSPCYPVPGLPGTKPLSRDEHDWAVWHSRAPVEHYETTRHRFVSEFGMQSYPSPEVAATFCPPEEMNVFSPTFDNHQKNAAGNQIIADYVSRLFRFPKDYRSLAYLSQLNQAYCMKTAVEHFRRTSPRCLGALYWQLNDCWPVASWSGLEFGGKWKALQYCARRFFAPTLVVARRLGAETRGIGNYARNTFGRVELYTVHEGPRPLDATLAWRLCTMDGTVVTGGEKTLTLHPDGGTLQQSLDLTQQVERFGSGSVLLRVALRDADGRERSGDTVLFTAPRNLSLVDKPITTAWRPLEPGRFALTLASTSFHYGVCLELEGTGVAWSDNFFDLLPNEPREIVAQFPAAAADDALAGLRVFSLVHTYAR